MDSIAFEWERGKQMVLMPFLSTSQSIMLWHQCLGHPSFAIVSHILDPSLSLNRDHIGQVYSTCQWGQNCQLFFSPYS